MMRHDWMVTITKLLPGAVLVLFAGGLSKWYSPVLDLGIYQGPLDQAVALMGLGMMAYVAGRQGRRFLKTLGELAETEEKP